MDTWPFTLPCCGIDDETRQDEGLDSKKTHANIYTYICVCVSLYIDISYIHIIYISIYIYYIYIICNKSVHRRTCCMGGGWRVGGSCSPPVVSVGPFPDRSLPQQAQHIARERENGSEGWRSIFLSRCVFVYDLLGSSTFWVVMDLENRFENGCEHGTYRSALALMASACTSSQLNTSSAGCQPQREKGEEKRKRGKGVSRKAEDRGRRRGLGGRGRGGKGERHEAS
jgi:hypothetical protein